MFAWYLYLVARTLAFPLLVLYFLYRGCRDRRYFRHFGERLGWLPASFKRTAPGCIWLHAVSVGEVISSLRLIEALRRENPHLPIYVSTATLAGRAIAVQKLTDRVQGIFYAPVDYAFAVRRVLRRIRPAAVVILETEIWPVLYREAKRAGCQALIVNGRISDRALPKYRRFRWFFRAALACPDAIFVQSEADRRRYLDIGAPSDRIHVAGNLKYDAPEPGPPPAAIVDFIQRVNPEPVWIAASTMPGVDASDVDESEVVLGAFQKLAEIHPRILLIIAPRKPERFDVVANALRARGINYVRRSGLDSASTMELPGVLLLDSIGELASTFVLAGVVFMGGTLARRGGHNILEPAFAARPIVIGPHMENFAAIAGEFRSAKAVVEIDSPAALSTATDRLFRDRAARETLGNRAAELAAAKRGVTARIVQAILDAQDRAMPAWNLRGFWKTIAGWLALLWQWGGALRRSRPRSLPVPVISVGGLAMGGSGKTPFTLALARSLRDRGLQPAILTRGYRRRSPADVIVVPAGAGAPSAITGDEAQIFVRSGVAHVGIGSDRWRAGAAVSEKLPVNVFLLDDGFQHRRLARDVDIVLIDALDPFAGGAVFPRGRLREPPSALARAGVLVIARAQPGRAYHGLRDRLRELNPRAPVYVSTVAPTRWMDAITGQESPQPASAGAFCGLGNPNSFWQTLRGLGLEPAFTWAFGDHHVYKPVQLRRLSALARASGAAALVTTQKDLMNLPDDFARLIAPVKLYCLEVECRIENERDLLALIENEILTGPRRSSPSPVSPLA